MAPEDRTELDIRAFVIAMVCGVLSVAVLTALFVNRPWGPPVIIVSSVALGLVVYKLLARPS